MSSNLYSKHNTRVSYGSGSGSGSNSKNEISFDEQNEIVRNFPSTIKFSYERSTHKKVLSDIFIIIPKGKKYFVWFTHRNRKNICIFLEIGYQNKIMNVFYRHVSFDDVLSYGTIFYGTLFRTKRDASSSCQNNSEIFSVEDIFYYKGDDISEYIYEKKLKVIKNIFDTNLRYNISFFKNGVVFGLPVITTDFVDALDKADKLPYSVYSIQYRYLGYKQDNNNSKSLIEFYHFNNGNGISNSNGVNNGSSSVIIDPTPPAIHAIHATATITTTTIIEKNETIKQQSSSSSSSYSSSSNEIYKWFNIKPDLQNDVYYLYPITTTNFATISKEIAHIPDYKTSVLMNKLFRNIKENINLDSLEESDEEEEFENIQIDKFVDLNKTIKMRCIFNYKFKKWVPVSVI